MDGTWWQCWKYWWLKYVKMCWNVHITHLHMMLSSYGNIFRLTGHLCGEFTGPREFPTQRPVTRSFDVFFDLHLNKRLSKQWWGWWFETLSHPLWCHPNELSIHVPQRSVSWSNILFAMCLFAHCSRMDCLCPHPSGNYCLPHRWSGNYIAC